MTLLQSSKARSQEIDDPLLIRDVFKLLKIYAQSDMIFDILANAPIVIFSLTYPHPDDEEGIEEMKNNTTLTWCLGLKMLRLAHGYKVKITLTLLMDKLSDLLNWQKYLVDNLLQWSKTTYIFLLGVHYLACFWVLIYVQKDLQGLDHHEFVQESNIYRYFESVYFISTTISTVGYGDPKGFIDTSGSWTQEMCYLIVTTFTGILLFTVVTNDIFNYNKFKTLN